MRTNDTQKANQIINQVFKSNNIQDFNKGMIPINDLSKKELWCCFLRAFREIHGQEFQ
jgi:hypothetical protein